MEGDKILILDEHREKATIVFDKIKEINKDRIVLGISGISGTGKTEIAHVLRSLLYKEGIGSVIASMDDFYKTYWKERNDIRKRTGIIGLEEIEWDWIEHMIYRFRKVKSTAVIRRINKYTGGLEYIYFSPKEVPTMIIEGLYSINADDLDLRVYLDGTIDGTEPFRMIRKKEEQNEFRQHVLIEEEKVVISLKDKADIII